MMKPDSLPSPPATPPGRTFSRLRLLVAAQVLVLLGIAGLSAATDRWGQALYLRTRPVDPRDLLYGDYVRLAYDFSQAETALWRGPGPLPDRGRSVWLLLRPAAPSWQPVGLFGEAPTPGPGQAVLRGLVQYGSPGRVSVRYGLERWYLPENTGQRLENASRDSAGLLVRVQVAPWGTTRLHSVQTR